MNPSKACPVVVRQREGVLEILAFRHPLAGCQLVKGSIETEAPAAAAVRELYEEAGVRAFANSDLGVWDAQNGHAWSFHLCTATTPLPETWTHRCEDDGGHDFYFFWHPLLNEPSPEWHSVHAQALGFIKSVLTLGATCEDARA